MRNGVTAETPGPAAWPGLYVCQTVMSNCERLRPVQAIHNAGLWAAHVSRGKLGHAFVLCTNWGDNPDAILGNSLNFSAVNHTDLAHAARCMGLYILPPPTNARCAAVLIDWA